MGALSACGGGAEPAVTPVAETATESAATAAQPAEALPPVADAPSVPAVPVSASVELSNALAKARTAETIALSRADLVAAIPEFDPQSAIVTDEQGAEVLSQWVDIDANGEVDELVFQADFAASATRSFAVRKAPRTAPAVGAYKVYGRHVRERFDDFAWENDLIAARMYGPALEKAPKEPLVSSGTDAWVKKEPARVINDWFLTGTYHDEQGLGGDFYSVGPTRGCGGVGIWANGKLSVSKNYVSSRVITSGPIRLIFELEYAAWQAGGRRVKETKRIQLDAGSSFNRLQSRFTGVSAPLGVALGIAKHAGTLVGYDAATSSLRVWEPLNQGKNGNLGCAVVLPQGTNTTQEQDEKNFLLVSQAPKDGVVGFRTGWAWDGRGLVKSPAEWEAEVAWRSARDAAPIGVKVVGTVAPAASAAPASAEPAPAVSPTLAVSAAPVAAVSAPAAPAVSVPPTVIAPAATVAAPK